VQASLRSEYRFALHSEEESVRWRIVHALGASPSAENADLLFNAAFTDPYMWARFGAVRSVLEISARTDDDVLRKRLLNELTLRLHEITEPLINVEIRWCCFASEAPFAWTRLLLPMVDRGAAIAPTESEREEWRKIGARLLDRLAHSNENQEVI